jgi:hypothetical protein
MSDGREEREEQEKRRELLRQQPRPESRNHPIDPSEYLPDPDPWEPERGGS